MSFTHRFVEAAPESLEPGVVYVSVEFSSVLHLCLCGCGNEVVTPLSPADWKLVFDGESISLDPSIGNWSQPCRSHYWIRKGKVQWAGDWSDKEIEKGRRETRSLQSTHFGLGNRDDEEEPQTSKVYLTEPKLTLWQRIKKWAYK